MNPERYIRDICKLPRRWSHATFLALGALICHSLLVADTVLDFNRNVRPILSEHCFPCHGPDRNHRKAELRLDLPDGLTESRENGPILSPGKPEYSLLILRILSEDPDEVMPPSDALLDLTKHQKDLLVQWVKEGAQWERHWSFMPPQDWALPEIQSPSWARLPLDYFVLAQLESMGRSPSAQADARTLIRRLSFDLTGLPPPLETVDAFEKSFSEDTYDALVESLLASPQFGERMALPWMDAARYADTHGYQNDGDREMWRWRDWVIDAFNANMPFDQFTVEQLAGDLLPNATLDQTIATGFNRNHRYNSEGGSIPQEVLTENVADRVETTSTTWLGLTMGCARCHDHKYDPLTMKDYYGMFAFFHNVPETGRAIRDGNSEPFILAPTWQQQETLLELESSFNQALSAAEALRPLIDQTLTRWHSDQQWKNQELSFIPNGLIHARSFENTLEGEDVQPLKEKPDHAKLKWGKGIQGAGIHLNGEWDGSLGDIGRFHNMTPYSISLWINPGTTQGGAVFSRIQDGVDGKGYQLVYEEGHLRYLSISQGYAGRIGARTVQAFPQDQWHHVTVTYDATMSARGIRIYVNGENAQLKLLRNNDSNPGGISTQPFRLGASEMAGNFNGMVDELKVYNRVLIPDEIKALSEPSSLQSILAQGQDSWTPRQFHVVRTVFLEKTDHLEIRQALERVLTSQRLLAAFKKTLPTLMVMEEMEEARQTHILVRGQYDQLGEPIEAGVPSFLAEWGQEYPRNRLGLAQWLVSGKHPLTARVFVNRIWQMLFGQGLVETAEDFGVQGSLPSHPELLDWLAVDFVKSGWDIKRLVKSIVSSATYRQRSNASVEMLSWDPGNKWLARGPQKRLPAHFVRDQLLAISGLKMDSIGGAPVFPYQPNDLWEEVSRKSYPESKGEGLYRRSVYTYFKRTVAPPLMQTFDAADRESCIVNQHTTNTPLQALAMLNAPILLEAALELAKSAQSKADATADGQVSYLFRQVLLRAPNEREHQTLCRSFENYQSMTSVEQESMIVELGKPALRVAAEVFPSFCVSLTLLGLDETLSPR